MAWTGIRRAVVGGIYTQTFSPPINIPADIGFWVFGQPSFIHLSNQCIAYQYGQGFVDLPCIVYEYIRPICEIQQLNLS